MVAAALVLSIFASPAVITGGATLFWVGAIGPGARSPRVSASTTASPPARHDPPDPWLLRSPTANPVEPQPPAVERDDRPAIRPQA
jgi:hypothetical protein